MRGGMVAPHVDPGAALVLAQAQGIQPVVAGPLVVAVQNGMAAGMAKRKEGKA